MNNPTIIAALSTAIVSILGAVISLIGVLKNKNTIQNHIENHDGKSLCIRLPSRCPMACWLGNISFDNSQSIYAKPYMVGSGRKWLDRCTVFYACDPDLFACSSRIRTIPLRKD